MLRNGFPLLDLVLPVINELDRNTLPDKKREAITEHILAFINKERTYESLIKELSNYPSIFNEVNKIRAIMDTENQPIPNYQINAIPHQGSKHKNLKKHSTERNQMRHWNYYEDYRLLMGIRLYGLDDWNSVAKYVGNGRIRSQCMQRWSRGLDPRISKDSWTKEEEKKLISLVNEHKNVAWTQIAAALGNRTDVQCRYRYRQLCKINKVPQNIGMAGYLKEKAEIKDRIDHKEEEKKAETSILEPDNKKPLFEKEQVAELELEKTLNNFFNEEPSDGLVEKEAKQNVVSKCASNFESINFDGFSFEDIGIMF